MSTLHPPSNGKLSSKHLLFLDGIRGLSALYVVLHHFLSWSSVGVSRPLHYAVAWTSFGHFAVCIFIVLSGFSLMLQVVNSPDQNLRGGPLTYLKRRAWRILPPYFAALTISILTLAAITAWIHPNELHTLPDLSAASIISHFLLLHNLSSQFSLGINMAHWTVATEWQIYFLLPFVLLPAWRLWKPLCLVVGLVIGLAPHYLLPVESNLDWACPWFVALFALGMLIATYHGGECASQTTTRLWLGGMVLSIFGYLALKAVCPGDQFAWTRDLCAGLLVSCFIAWCSDALKLQSTSPTLVKILESPACVKMGMFSYSLYLTHCVILNIFNAISHVENFSPDMALVLRACIGVPIAVLAAYIFYVCFERPYVVRKTKA